MIFCREGLRRNSCYVKCRPCFRLWRRTISSTELVNPTLEIVRSSYPYSVAIQVSNCSPCWSRRWLSCSTSKLQQMSAQEMVLLCPHLPVNVQTISHFHAKTNVNLK